MTLIEQISVHTSDPESEPIVVFRDEAAIPDHIVEEFLGSTNG